VDTARSQTAMTHNHALVIDAAKLFAGTSVLVLKGVKPLPALLTSLEKIPLATDIQKMVSAGIESRSEDTRKTIARFGQTCSIQAALPSTVHLIARYEDNLKEALIENIMAGGDSSARGMIAGYIIGCYQGLGNIPVSWVSDMRANKRITHLLQ